MSAKSIGLSLGICAVAYVVFVTAYLALASIIGPFWAVGVAFLLALATEGLIFVVGIKVIDRK